MKTIQEAAQVAIDCQDACNLSGVAFSFAQAMKIICDEANAKGYGTAWKNAHPIVILFVDKLADLSGARLMNLESNAPYRTAYGACVKLASGMSQEGDPCPECGKDRTPMTPAVRAFHPGAC